MLNSAAPQYREGALLSLLAYDLPITRQRQWKNPNTHQYYTIYQLPFETEVCGYLLLPVNKNDHNVKIIFRGTDPSLSRAGTLSAMVNLESWGPGFESFQASKEGLFSLFIQKIKEHYGNDLPPLNLSVSGHSQGGALAQLFVTEFLRQRLTHQDYIAFQSIVMNAFNSPGVSYSITEQCDALARYQFCRSAPFAIRANYGMIGGDPVQTLGLDMIFTNTPPEIAEVTVLKLDKGQEGHWKACLDDGLQWDELRQFVLFTFNGIMGTHPVSNFTWAENDPYAFYSNTVPEEIPSLRYELGYKTMIWPSIGYYIARSLFLDEFGVKYLSSGAYNGVVNAFCWLREKALSKEQNDAPPSVEGRARSSSPS